MKPNPYGDLVYDAFKVAPDAGGVGPGGLERRRPIGRAALGPDKVRARSAVRVEKPQPRLRLVKTSKPGQKFGHADADPANVNQIPREREPH